MYLVNRIKSKIEEYLFAIHSYDPKEGWKFDSLLELDDGSKVGLFASDLNLHLNKFHNGNKLFFLAFHANRFNPHEKNLFLLFFEIYDSLVHKETEIFFVKYHTKPYIIQNMLITGIPVEAIYTPSFHFQKDILLLDAEMAPDNIEKLALLNLQIKAILKNEIEKLALFYFFERLLTQQGFVASYCEHLFLKNNIDMAFLKANLNCLPYLARSLETSNIPGYHASMYSNLEALLNSLEVNIDYRGTNQQFFQKGSKLMLAPVVNEIYLKLFEYFIDSEFPFICNFLLKNITANNTSVISKARKLITTL